MCAQKYRDTWVGAFKQSMKIALQAKDLLERHINQISYGTVCTLKLLIQLLVNFMQLINCLNFKNIVLDYDQWFPLDLTTQLYKK